MHFVDKTAVPPPALLKKLAEKEIPKWLAYYRRERSKPKKFWTKEKIRFRLAERVFKQNCGYCGMATDVKTGRKGKKLYTGQVDHYHPVSKVPEKAYDWDNYIWSCPDCNLCKGLYYDPRCMILNPCSKEDMDCLIYDAARGIYSIKEKYKNNNVLRKRYEITEEKTFIHSGMRILLRKIFYNNLDALAGQLKRYEQLMSAGLEEYEEKAEKIRGDIIELRKNNPNFKKLAAWRMEEKQSSI